MSVGHVQRAFESAGIPTVGVYVAAFGHIPELMGVGRALITNHPMGRPLGAPGDSETQMRIVRSALELLTAAAPSIATLPDSYRARPQAQVKDLF